MANRNAWRGVGYVIGAVYLGRMIGTARHWDRTTYWICALLAAPLIASAIWLAIHLIREEKEYKRQLESGELFDPKKMGSRDKAWEEYKAKHRDR